MNLQTFITQKRADFITICQLHKVDKLYAFGSAVSDRFDENSSDIDVIAEVAINDPVERGETLLSLWNNLEVFFSRKVDLLTAASIKNPYLKSNLERTKQLIYDGNSQEVFI